MKFIVSSQAFWMLMERSRGRDIKDYNLIVEGKKVHFNGIAELDVESKEDAQIELSKKKFNRLRKVVRALEDQPIVIYVVSHALHIQNIVF